MSYDRRIYIDRMKRMKELREKAQKLRESDIVQCTGCGKDVDKDKADCRLVVIICGKDYDTHYCHHCEIGRAHV